MEEIKETTLSSELIYDGRIMRVYKDKVMLQSGKESVREYIRHSGGASVLAVDEDENIYLVSQFRYPYASQTLEIPAGKKEYGEQPLVCAKRELEEETGLVADNIRLISTVYPTPAYTDEKLYVYLATGLKKTQAHLDEGEFLNVIKMPFAQALELAKQGKINDSKTLVAIYYYAATKGKED